MTAITHSAPLAIDHSRPQVSEIGTALCKKVEDIYQNVLMMCTLLENARNQPTRTTNAVFSLFSGVTMCIGGSFTGVIGVLSGTRDLYNLSRGRKLNPVEDVLKGISAGIDAIGIIGKDQEKHLCAIENNLSLIKQSTARLHANLDEIHSLNKLGLVEVRSAQNKALSLNVQALELYRKANELFDQAQNVSNQARTSFEHSSSCFTEILDVGKSANPDVDSIKLKALNAVASSKVGIAQLEESERIFTEAFAAFYEANTFKTQALNEIFLANEKAKEVMRLSQEKSQFVEEFNSKFAAAELELDQAKNDITDILKLVDSLEVELFEANNAIREKLSGSELFAGILGSLAVAPLASGIVGSVVAVGVGVGAAYGLHHSEDISNTAKRIYGYWFGEPQGLGPVTLLNKGEILRVRFDRDSSGNWGKLMKRSSHTTGQILLDVGDITPHVLPFNLNNKSPVSQLDLLNLFKILSRKIGDNSMQPEYCLQILRKLQTAQVIEGGDAFRERFVVLLKEHVMFTRIKSMCLNKIKRM